MRIARPDHRDPYLIPHYSFRNKVRRGLWCVLYALLFRTSPRPLFAWRRFLLKSFGAELSKSVRIYPGARIWAPWKLVCEDVVTIADEAIIYNPELVYLESHAIVSRQAYICGATHDYNDPAFPIRAFSMRLGAYSWICARASVQPGVNVGAGAVLALGSVASRDLDPWTVYGGVPARPIKARRRIEL
jgi:putative colanic acid biosynthesis acetyltransferase WcaF